MKQSAKQAGRQIIMYEHACDRNQLSSHEHNKETKHTSHTGNDTKTVKTLNTKGRHIGYSKGYFDCFKGLNGYCNNAFQTWCISEPHTPKSKDRSSSAITASCLGLRVHGSGF